MNLSYAIIYVDDVVETVEFYERAFGLERAFIHESNQFAQMKTGTTALAFTSHELGASAVPLEYQHSNRLQPPFGVELTLTSTDVTAAYDRAVEAGAEPVAEPHDTSWGQTVSYVRDLAGILIGIATPM